MAKKPSKPISIRYTCPPDGNQVGLSHYLMAEAKKGQVG
jgi:modified peptide precursor CbpA